MRNQRYTELIAGLFAGVSLATLAVAQTPPPAPGKTRVEEVTVTAQKRSESVRKVPISVTVLSGRQIRADHIQSFADLSRNVPNLSFSSQAGEGLSTLEIRGISSQAGTATVAVYLDDVSLTTRNLSTEGTAEPRFIDISRVEVLRGPQGTLYGASAMGGTLKYISNPPKLDTFEGNLFSELSGTYHGAGPNWDEQGVLNIPIVKDQLALRITAENGGDGGYIKNIDPSTAAVKKYGINSDTFNVVRGTLLWQPNDWLTITPAAFWQNFNSHDSDAQYTDLPRWQTPKTVAEPGRDVLIVPSLTMNADLDWANLIGITSNYERQFKRTLDSTIYDNLSLYVCDPLNQALTCTDDAGLPVYNAPKGLYNALFDLPSQTYYSNTVRQWAQEFRLVSKPYEPGGLPFTWLLGLYYSDENTTTTDTEFVRGANATFARFGANPADPTVISGGFPTAITDDNVYYGLRRYETTQYAGFGEGTYYPESNIRLTFGARYLFARDSEFTSQYRFYSYGNQGTTSEVGHFYAFTPKFAAGWDVNPQNTIYATISKGFRLGSENRPIEYIPGDASASGTPSYDLAQLGLHSAPTNFGPDKLWNYEIGDKGRLFGGRMVFSADFFYIMWDDIQVQVPLVTSGDEFETNGGSATSYGAEFETHTQVTDTLTAGVSGSVVNATLDNGVIINGHLVNGSSPGEKIPGVPEYSLDFEARQNFIINDRTTGFFRFNIPWVGDSHGDVLTTNPDYKRPSYVTVDATLGLDYGQWEFTLFGRNLTNNNKIIQRPDIQGSASPLYGFTYLGQQLRNVQGFTLQPFTIGMNAALKF